MFNVANFKMLPFKMQIIFVFLYFLKYDKVLKCTDYGENYGILMLLSDFVNIHFKTPY